MASTKDITRIFIPRVLTEELKDIGNNKLHIELTLDKGYDINYVGKVIEVSGYVESIAIK